jgi:hypothetical protein
MPTSDGSSDFLRSYWASQFLGLLPDRWFGVHAGASDRFVVSASQYGLCNRLKSLLSAMRVAERLSRSVAIYWPENNLVNCRFSDLFDNSLFEIPSANGRLKIRSNEEKYCVVDTWRLLTFPGELPANFAREYPSTRGGEIDGEYGRIPVSTRNAYLGYVRQLSPAATIQARVDAFAKLFNDRTVSVSVRSWPEHRLRAETLFRIENVFAAMDRHEGAEFFVSADSEEVMQQLLARYGRRILRCPKQTSDGDRNTRAGMQEILIDLLLLSKNRHLIASAYSTFPEVAWWLGGCMADVEIIESEECLAVFRKTLTLDDPYTRLAPADLLQRAITG